jgi:alpha-glucosidase
VDIKLALNAIQSLGVGTAGRIVRNALYRDYLNRTYKVSHASPIKPGLIVHTRLLPSGAHFQYENAEMEIVFLAPDLARITWQVIGNPLPLPIPYALARTDWPPVTDRWQVDLEEMTFSTRAMHVSVQNDGGLIFRDTSENNIREELPPEFYGNGVNQNVLLEPDAHIYGLGERSTRLNRRMSQSDNTIPRERVYRMWNTDPGGAYSTGIDPLYINIPLFVDLHSQGSYLAFYENSFPATFSFGTTADIHFDHGPLRYYIITGPINHLYERYTELTGRPPLPPRWVLGYHQCRWGYKTETDIREVIAGFRDNNMPISAIHLDIDYMDGYRVFTVDRERFPDLKSLTSDLEKEGIKTVTILDPGIKKDPAFDIYRDGVKENLFIKNPNGKPIHGVVWPGWSAFPDFTDPKTRQWWGSFYPRLHNLGVAGYWHDMNEPASLVSWGDPTLPLVAQQELEGRKGQHAEAHNVYGLLMARAGYEALHQQLPDRRPWILTRAGWAGMQRYAWSWTGDTETSWESLRMTIPEVVSLGLSGVPFTGPDIGGFSSHPDAELYTRWFQLSTFLPFFRTHSVIGTPRREPWVYGEPTTSILRNFLNLRYQMMPFLYTQVWDSCHSGHPFTRPLFWQDPADERLWDIDDSFMIGDSLLVAPVINQNTRNRSVVLPRGEWYNFWNYSALDDDLMVSNGPGKVEFPTSIEQFPVLVRAGSIIPLDENGKQILHLYPISASDSPLAARGTLYTDEGDGYGSYRLDHFHLNRTQDGFELNHISDGEYPFPKNGLAIKLHGFHASQVLVDGTETDIENNRAEVGNFTQVLIAIKVVDKDLVPG